MSAYTMTPNKNSLKKKMRGTLEYTIVGDVESMSKIQECRVNVLELTNDTDWQAEPGTCDVEVLVKRIPAEGLRTTAVFTFSKTRTRKPFSFIVKNILPRENINGKVYLTVSLKDNNKELTEPLTGSVFIEEEIPIIEYFHVDPSIVKSKDSIAISLSCTNIDEYGIRYEDGTNVCPSEQLTNQKRVNIQNQKVKLNFENRGVAKIFLEAKRTVNGETLLAKENNVRTIQVKDDNKSWEEVSLDELIANNYKSSEMIDLVKNECNGKIWGFGKFWNDDIIVWNSPDGIKWNPVINTSNYNSDRKVSIHIDPKLVHSPSIFFRMSNLQPYRLYFVGGSKYDLKKFSNEMYSYDCSDYKESLNTEEVIHSDWEPRTGHGIVVFPDDIGNDNIWVIGGADQAGNGLKDVWRWNGTEWKEVETPDDFPKRCQFSITVHNSGSDREKKEIWIGGGFEDYDGDPAIDMWRYYKNENIWKWEPVMTYASGEFSRLQLCRNNEWLITFAITSLYGRIHSIAVTKNNQSIASSNRLIAPDGKRASNKPSDLTFDCFNWVEISTDSGKWAIPPEGVKQRDSYILETIGFNGCIWLLALRDVGKDQINISSLYYMIKSW
jgi:hypothetical protein